MHRVWVGQIIIVERNSGMGRFGLPLKKSFMFGVIIVVGLWVWVWNLANRRVLLKSLGPANPHLPLGPCSFGPFSLTSNHTISHLPSCLHSKRIKRSKDNSDITSLHSIPFIVDKIVAIGCFLCPEIQSLQVHGYYG